MIAVLTRTACCVRQLFLVLRTIECIDLCLKVWKENLKSLFLALSTQSVISFSASGRWPSGVMATLKVG